MRKTWFLPVAEKNFALEKYGNSSKCFDHTDHMWEERSCRQTREWQHWGSGCYEYQCVNGRLSITVGNYSYECFYPGQELSIRINYGDWLHIGAIMCPPCREVCGEYFAKRNESCRIREEAPPGNMYPRDNLACSASKSTLLHAVIVQVVIGLILFKTIT